MVDDESGGRAMVVVAKADDSGVVRDVHVDDDATALEAGGRGGTQVMRMVSHFTGEQQSHPLHKSLPSSITDTPVIPL